MSKYDSFWCIAFQWMSLWRSDKFLLTLSLYCYGFNMKFAFDSHLFLFFQAHCWWRNIKRSILSTWFRGQLQVFPVSDSLGNSDQIPCRDGYILLKQWIKLCVWSEMVCMSDNFGNYAFNTMGILYDFIYEQMWWLHQELFIRPFFSPKVYVRLAWQSNTHWIQTVK